MTRLAAKNGWFVPVTTLLDYLADAHGPDESSRPRSGAVSSDAGSGAKSGSDTERLRGP